MKTTPVLLAGALVYALAAFCPPAGAQTITYIVVSEEGTRLGSGTLGDVRVLVPLGASLQFDCKDGRAYLEEVRLSDGGTTETGLDNLKGKLLPLSVTSGKSGVVGARRQLVFRFVMGTPGEEDANKPRQEAVVAFVDDLPWWAIGDTVAYAITRQTGNTAVAGAGVFLELSRVRFLRWLPRGSVQYVFAVHLLPPPKEGTAADIGLAPVGLGFFGSRLVMGFGSNVSNRGLRPRDHDRYFYVGFSASSILRPKAPK